MKKVPITAIILLLSLQAFSQTFLVQVKPKGSGDWGYANEKGEIVIPAKYSLCFPFSKDGFAVIHDVTTGFYFFINTKGEKLKTVVRYCELISNMGYNVEGFSSGLAAVKVNNKWGYLDKSGKMAIYPKYSEANRFSGGYASVKVGKKNFIIDSVGHESEIINGNIKTIKKFTDGIAPYLDQNGLFGFINTNGIVLTEAKYISVGPFVNHIAWVKNSTFGVGYINNEGEEFIKPQFNVGYNFDQYNGFARVKINNAWYYVNKDFRLVKISSITITNGGDFSDGLAMAEQNGKFGFINYDFNWVIKPQFDGARDFKNGFAAVKVGNAWGLINTKGEIIAQPQFSAIKDVELIR